MGARLAQNTGPKRSRIRAQPKTTAAAKRIKNNARQSKRCSPIKGGLSLVHPTPFYPKPPKISPKFDNYGASSVRFRLI